MSQKIKSIKVIKDYPSQPCKVGQYIPELSIQAYTQRATQYPEFFEIEYEKPTLLKRPDGSLISETREGLEILKVYHDGSTYKENFGNESSDIFFLQEGLIFLLQDLHLAENKAKMLIKQLEIQYEIDKLNAEEEDKSDQMYTFICISNQIGVQGVIEPVNGQVKFSQKTAQTILEKYSQEELKQYLGIII